MDKKQVEKFRRFMDSRYPGGVPPFDKYRDLIATIFFNDAWTACLKANGIGEKKDEKPYRVYVFKNMNEMKQFAKDRIEPDLADNPFYNTDLGESYEKPTLIDLVREISSSVKDIAKKLEPEVVNVETKGFDLQKLLDDLKKRIDEEKGKATFGIPKEAKEWTPELRQSVFGLDNNGCVCVGIVVSIQYEQGIGYRRYGIQDANGLHQVKFVKPLNPASIGKPWSEI